MYKQCLTTTTKLLLGPRERSSRSKTQIFIYKNMSFLILSNFWLQRGRELEYYVSCINQNEIKLPLPEWHKFFFGVQYFFGILYHIRATWVSKLLPYRHKMWLFEKEKASSLPLNIDCSNMFKDSSMIYILWSDSTSSYIFDLNYIS